MKVQEIKALIEEKKKKLEKVKNVMFKDTDASLKPIYEKQVSKITAELEGLEKDLEKAEKEEKEAEEKEKEQKAKKEKATNKVVNKGRRGRPKKSEAKKDIVKKDSEKPAKKKRKDEVAEFEYEGKTYTKEDIDFCKILLKKHRERRMKQKKASKKYRTKSVFSKISSNVASSVKKAIINVPDEKLKTKSMLTKIQALEESAKQFLRSFRSVLGDDYESEQIKEAEKEINQVIDRLIKKVKGKDE